MHRVILDTDVINNFENYKNSPLKKGYLLIKDDYFYFSVEPIPEKLSNFTRKELKKYLENTYAKSAIYFSINNCNLKLKTNTNIPYNFYDIAFGSKKFLMVHDYKTKKDTSFKNIHFDTIIPILFNYNSKPLNLALKYSYFIITIIYGIFIFKLLMNHTLIAYSLIILWGISCSFIGHYLLKNIKKNIETAIKTYKN